MPSRRRHRTTTPGAPTTAAAEVEGPRAVRRITDAAGARALAHHLLDPTRARPVVVVTVPSGRTEPFIDAEAIARAVGDLAEVAVVPTDHTGWRLSEQLPPLTAVYGGAGRVYPVGTAWRERPALAPLRFAYTPEEGEAAVAALTSDALRLAEEAGVARATGGTAGAEPVSGEVIKVLPPSRALVRLEGGQVVTIWSELTVPDVPADRLFVPGQRVTGRLTDDRLDVSGMLERRESAPAPGEIVLARVTAVRPDVVHLALAPRDVVAVPRDRATSAEDRLTDLFSVGEVVIARVAWLGPGDKPALRLDDVGPDAVPAPAPAILPGGPPWLRPQDTETEPAPVDEPTLRMPRDRPAIPPLEAPGPPPASAEPVTPSPKGAAATMALSLEAARAQVRAQTDRADRAEAELAEARRVIANLTDLARSLQEDRGRLQRQVQAQRTQLRLRVAARRKEPGTVPGAPEASGPAFLDPEEQFRHEVLVTWAELVPAGEKAARPLPAYRVGPEFLPSLEVAGAGLRPKVVRVVVEVLTGWAEELAGREVHRLRTGEGGDDPVVVRADGAVCWRASVQRHAPAARRLHYWKLGDQVELSRVALHDDTRP